MPHPHEGEIVAFYAQAAQPNDWEVVHYVEFDEARQEGARQVATKLTLLNGGPGRLLELGCAAGWVLKSAQEQGWEVTGIEAAPKFSEYATEALGLRVHAGTLTDFDASGAGSFDLVYASDVLEHLADPVGELKRLRALISEQGFLVVTVPRIDSLVARLYGLKWRQILVSHVSYWTPKSVNMAMRAAGFQIERISEPRYWDPDPGVESRQHQLERLKLLARAVLVVTYVPLSHRARRRGWQTRLDDVVRAISRGRLTDESLLFKVGDQPVLGDVMLVVAQPAMKP